MIKKMQITQNFSDVKSWHPSVQLLVALAILCWGSTARAQQSETWVGTNNLGWILQAQTNDSNTGLTPSSNWVDVPGSALITNTVITVDPKQPAVFYRMRNPSASAE